MAIGQSVRTYREANGLTQRQLADKLGVTTQYVSFLETEKKRPSDNWIKGLSIPALRAALAEARIKEHRATIAELKELVA